MRKLLKIAVAVVTLGAAATSLSAQVVASAHDFTVLSGPLNYAFQTRSSNICGTCHTIHNALSQDAPLWIHTTTTATFTPYSSATMNAVAGQPVSVSRACLSCHDGTVAVNSVNGTIGTGGIVSGPVFIGGAALIGTDLSNDHPISISYDAGDPDMNPLATVQGIYPLYGASKNQVECGTCHDPHTPGSNGLFFRPTPTTYRSRCIVCHNK